MQAIFLEDEQNVKAFISALSKPRLTKYLQHTNGGEREALLLYHWNSQLSQALYLPLQSWEIVLRNKINNFFIYKYTNPAGTLIRARLGISTAMIVAGWTKRLNGLRAI